MKLAKGIGNKKIHRLLLIAAYAIANGWKDTEKYTERFFERPPKK